MAMSAKSQRIWRGIWGLVVIVPLTALAGAAFQSSIVNTRYLFFMRPVDATVAEVIKGGPASGPWITLKYQYGVGNRQHSGSYGWVKGHAGTDRLAELTAGQTVQVHYWRATPNESILLVGSKNVVGALLVILPFLLVCASELQFAFTGQVKWLTIAPGATGFHIVNPPWGHALTLVLFVSGAVHLTLSITILPWRASVISGLLLTFCILPVAARLIIKRTAAASAKMEGG